MFRSLRAIAAPAAMILSLASCGGGGGGGGGGASAGSGVATSSTVPLTLSIGGTVSGLSAGTSVGLLDNNADLVTVTANGSFTFPTQLPLGATYAVTVGAPPAGETCALTNAIGTVGKANVTTISVVCSSASTYSIGGTVSGLATGTSVQLLDNNADVVTASANGAFTFPTPLPSGATYAATVGVQPSGQTCTVTNGDGAVGSANVASIVVACSTNPTFSISGTVSGLGTGAAVQLLDNNSDSVTVTANGSFTFPTQLPLGASYAVTVGAQPAGETCALTNAIGTVGKSNVTTISLVCSTASTYSIGGTVSGLATGTSVQLLDNNADLVTASANGAFTFPTPLPSGATYAATVGVQPSGQTCTVTNGDGAVGSANVASIVVACSTNPTFSISGTVSGLSTGAAVQLLDNNSDSVTVTANGAFTFATSLPNGAAYAATVGTQPSGETCVVTNGSGTVLTANVTAIAVVCGSNPTYSIGGTVSGLISGASVALLDNGADSIVVTANGTFVFPTQLPSGAGFAVTVGTAPLGQSCAVTNGVSTVGTANINNISIACTANPTFTIGGTISGLGAGAVVTLLDNSADTIAITANGSFTFPTPLPGGASYVATVGTQPSDETCVVIDGSGSVGAANVTAITVTCSPSTNANIRQSAQYTAYPGNNSTAWSVTLANVQAGSTIYVVGAWPNYVSSYPTMHVSDGTNTYTLLERYDDTTLFQVGIMGTESMGHWYAANVAAGTYTINMTPSPQTYEDWVGVVAFEIAGVSATPLDGHVLNFQANLAPGTSTVNATVTNANVTGIFVAVTFDDIDYTSPTVPLVGGGFTDAGSLWDFTKSGKPAARAEYSVVLSSGAHTATFSPQESGSQNPDYMTCAAIFH